MVTQIEMNLERGNIFNDSFPEHLITDLLDWLNGVMSS